MNEVIRFLQVRRPRSLSTQVSAGAATQLQSNLAELRHHLEEPLQRMEKAAADFAGSKVYQWTLREAAPVYALAHAALAASKAVDVQALKRALGDSPSTQRAPRANESSAAADFFADAIVALHVLRQGSPDDMETLEKALRVARMEERGLLAAGASGKAIEALMKAPVVLPSDIFPLPASKPADVVSSPLPERFDRQPAQRSLEEVLGLLSKEAARTRSTQGKPFEPASFEVPLERLSPSVKETLTSFGIEDWTATNVLATVEQKFLSASIGGSPHRTLVEHAGALLDLSGLLTGNAKPASAEAFSPQVRVGVGDLMRVEETLERYEYGEIAHIENVLATEKRGRKHRKLNRLTTVETTETEVAEESVEDLQTTDRYELQSEAARVVRQEFDTSIGTAVSGRYGVVSFEASASIDIGSSTETSARSAETFAQQVTEQSRRQIMERVRREQVREALAEIEETNQHQFDNTTDKHVVGIYRWIDKIHKAQLVHYGRRLMLEFMVPEPAALFLHSLAVHPPSGRVLQRPEPFNVPADFIEDFSYAYYAGLYGASVEPPPEPYKTVAVTTDFGKEVALRDHSADSSSHIIEIPEGYTATRAAVTITWGVTPVPVDANELDRPPRVRVAVGERFQDFGRTSGDAVKSSETLILSNERQRLPVSISVRFVGSVSVSVEVTCTVSGSKVQQWKLETYNAIRKAYQTLENDYQESVQSLRQLREFAAFDLPTQQYREIERRELKRNCISLLWGRHFDATDAIVAGAGGLPQIDFPAAGAVGKLARFFEDTVEWEQMTYEFFPYFWGGKERWLERLGINVADPVHLNFLQAGMARVVVPVRPGYERNVFRYLDTGEMQALPMSQSAASPQYADALGDVTELEKPRVVGAPWEVRVPTNLVMLQPDSNPNAQLGFVTAGDSADPASVVPDPDPDPDSDSAGGFPIANPNPLRTGSGEDS